MDRKRDGAATKDGVPRTRGDEPRSPIAGMSTGGTGSCAVSEAFPVLAGMNRINSHSLYALISVPRTRGDEPLDAAGLDCADWRSPYSRG